MTSCVFWCVLCVVVDFGEWRGLVAEAGAGEQEHIGNTTFLPSGSDTRRRCDGGCVFVLILIQVYIFPSDNEQRLKRSKAKFGGVVRVRVRVCVCVLCG